MTERPPRRYSPQSTDDLNRKITNTTISIVFVFFAVVLGVLFFLG